MQAAVQTTTEATPRLQASGRQTGAKGKQSGGFAAMLAALFNKGGSPEGLGEAGAVDGRGKGQSALSLLKEGAASKKFSSLSGLKEGAKDVAAEEEGAEALDSEAASLSLGLVAAKPLSKQVEGEVGLAALLSGAPRGKGMDLAGVESPALKGDGPRLSSKIPAAEGGASQSQVEVGVDRFAEMLRGTVDGKKMPLACQAAQVASAGAEKKGAEPLLSFETKSVEVLAGNASAPIARKGVQGVATKGETAKGVGLAGVLPVGLQAGEKAVKRPGKLVGKEALGKIQQPEIQPLKTSQDIKPVVADRFALSSQPLTQEATATLNELGTSAAIDAPKSGLTRQLALQVGRQVSQSLKNNDHDVVFQVRPPSLGRLQMHIEKEGGQISVRIVAEKEKAGEILATGKHDLRVLLADHGIKVDRIEVVSGGSMDFFAQDGSSGERRDRGRSSPHAGGGGAPGTPESDTAPLEKKRHDGVISVMV